VLGGSSSIDGLIYVRGEPEDFDHWAQLRNHSWSWDDFQKAVNWEGEEGEVLSKDGPLITSPVDRSPPPGDGIGWCQQTRGGRRRASAARTYLHPAMKRPNLQVVTKALVRRIIADGKRGITV
jgi:choline dehydrogenase